MIVSFVGAIFRERRAFLISFIVARWQQLWL